MDKQILTFDQIERALDAGRLEMVRPWGDWVRVRRRGSTRMYDGKRLGIPVYMENEVEAMISEGSAVIGYPDIRIS